LHVLDDAAADLCSLSFSALGVDLVDPPFQPGETAHQAHKWCHQDEPHADSDENPDNVVCRAILATSAFMMIATSLVVTALMVATSLVVITLVVVVIVMVATSQVSSVILIFLVIKELNFLGFGLVTAELMHLAHLLVEVVLAVELNEAENRSEENQESDFSQGAGVPAPVFELGFL